MADEGADEGVVAILLAAGGSRRMGGADKLWADLAGEPLIARPLRTLATMPEVDLLVVVAPAGRHAMLKTLAGEAAAQLRCVEGGARRQDSVAAAIAAAPEAAWYLVHDGARPLLSAALARATLSAARECGAAVPGAPVTDTLKRVDAGGRVIETLDRGASRAGLRAVQTPQAFAGALLRRAHASSHDDATDDAALVERLGEPVQVIDGDPANMKVTTAADLELVRAWQGAAGGLSPPDAPQATPRESG